METIELLNKKIKEGKSIAWYSIGYYISAGGEYSFSVKIPIFGTQNRDQNVCKVLIDFLGEMFWINVNQNQIYSGGGYGHDTFKAGRLLRFELEDIAKNN